MKAENIHVNPGFAKGLRPADHSRAHLKFCDFLTALPTAPLVDIAPNLSYPMDGNDVAGDCVVAGWDHFRQVVTQLLTGTGLNFTQDEIWAFYKTQNPNFDPTSTSTLYGPGSSADNGMNIQAFLEYLQQNKYILGFARIDFKNPQELQAAIYIGLAIMTGVVLDQVQMSQFNSGTWDYDSTSLVDGGHCIPLVGYPNNGATCVTWAQLINLTEPFIVNQMDEAWFVLTQYHLDHPNFRDNFDVEGFAKAVSEITGGQLSVPTPDPVKPSHYFSKTLSMGQTDPDVVWLQKCLNWDPQTALKAAPGAIGSPGHESDFFGALTYNAVESFQKKYGISQVGTVGPITRNELNALFSMSIDAAGLALIESFEGLSLTSYQDQGGTWTIGYGFTHDPNGNPITAKTTPITQSEASQWLKEIVVPYVDGVLEALTVTVTQNQLDALTSLCYNVGIGAFQTSSIVSKLNANKPVLSTDFTQYCHVNGVINQGLLNRREKEFALFTS